MSRITKLERIMRDFDIEAFGPVDDPLFLLDDVSNKLSIGKTDIMGVVYGHYRQVVIVGKRRTRVCTALTSTGVMMVMLTQYDELRNLVTRILN